MLDKKFEENVSDDQLISCIQELDPYKGVVVDIDVGANVNSDADVGIRVGITMNVKLDVDIDFADSDDVFLFMITSAENVQDSGMYLFMNSFIVASELDNTSELAAYIDYSFTGGVDYEYTFKYVYGEPGGDNVVLVDLPDPEQEDADPSSEDTKRRTTQQLILLTLGVIALIAIVYYFVL